ncbi:nuclear mitotic apparatus protein [Pimephales promelas]|nr:nuclear mitotic apparatus protein [Pimephales promelas]
MLLLHVLKKLLEEATTASQKDAELQNELHQQESLREKAQELETAKREELERTVDKDDQLGSLEKKLKEMEGLFLHRGSGHPTVLHALSENAHRGAQGRECGYWGTFSHA